MISRRWGMAASVAVGMVCSSIAQAEGDDLDALFVQRDQPGMADKNVAAVDAALKAAPDSYDVLWRAARWHCWVADGWLPKESPKREPEAKQCWDLGAAAVKVKPDGAEGNYYAGNGVGEWSDDVGIVKALTQGLEGIFNGYTDKAVKLNPSFHDCDPLVLKGRYFYALPWPKRDLKRSAETFQRGIAACPTRVRLFVYLAETQLKDGDAKAAKAILDKAKALAVGADPAESHRGQKLADVAIKKVEEELK